MMLQVGQTVYTVSRVEVVHQKPYRFKTYVAEKTVQSILVLPDDVIYTAGKYNELTFHAKDDGYETCTVPGASEEENIYIKPVFLDRDLAEAERLARIAREGNEVEQND